ncbi:hypothetical protein ACWCQM_17835 [Streptomyces sp. NPDC002125]
MTAPVFTAPEAAEDVTRMRGAFAVAVAVRALHLTPSGTEVWGWQGRTLGRRAGTSWLRAGAIAPVGYDPGLLHAYSLPVSTVAAGVRHEFADVLETPAGRACELVTLGQLLQACSRGVHPHLAPLVICRAEHLIGAPIPTP